MSTTDSKSGTYLERSYSSASASSTTSSRRSARRKRKRMKHTVMPLKKRPGRHELACDVHRITNLDHEEMNQSACFWVAKNPSGDESFKEDVYVNRDEDLLDELYLIEDVQTRTEDTTRREEMTRDDGQSPPVEGNYSEEKVFYGIRKAAVGDGGNVEPLSTLTSPRTDSRRSSLSDDSHSAYSSEGAGMHVGWTSDINNSSGPEYSGVAGDDESEDERGPSRPHKDLRTINDKWDENMESRGRRARPMTDVVVAQDVTTFESNQRFETEKQEFSSESGSADRDFPPRENPPPYNGRDHYPGEPVTNGHVYPGEITREYAIDTERGYTSKVPGDRIPSPINGRAGSPGMRSPDEVNGGYQRFVSNTLESSRYAVPGSDSGGPPPGVRTSTPKREVPSSDTELLRDNDVDDDQMSHRSLPITNKRTNTKYYSVEELRRSVETEQREEERAPLYVPRVSDEYMKYQPPRRVHPREDDPTGTGVSVEPTDDSMKGNEEPKVRTAGYELITQRSKMLVPGTSEDDKENNNPMEDREKTDRDTKDNFEDTKEFYGYRRQQDEESYSYSYSSVRDFNDKPRSRAPLRGGMRPDDEPMGKSGVNRDDKDNMRQGEAYVVDQPDGGEDRPNRNWEESKDFYGHRHTQEDNNYSYSTPRYPGGKPRITESERPGEELVGKAEVQQTYAPNEEHRPEDDQYEESKEFYGYRRRQEDGNYPYTTPNYLGGKPRGPREKDSERPGEVLVGKAEVQQTYAPNEEHRSEDEYEESKEFYGYRRRQEDGNYPYTTPNYLGGKPRGPREKDSERPGEVLVGKAEVQQTYAPNEEHRSEDGYEESKEFYGHRRLQEDSNYSYHTLNYPGEKPRETHDEGSERREEELVGKAEVQSRYAPGEKHRLEDDQYEESKEFYGYRRQVEDGNDPYGTPNYPRGKPRDSRDSRSEEELVGKAEVQQTFATKEEHRSEDGQWEGSKEFYGYRRHREDGNEPYDTIKYPGGEPRDTRDQKRERVREAFIGMKSETLSYDKDHHPTEQSKEFYSYRRNQGDHVYSHLTPKYVDAHDQERKTGEESTGKKQETTSSNIEHRSEKYEESKEFYGYRRRQDDGVPTEPITHAQEDQGRPPGKDTPGRREPERMVTRGYEVYAQKAMYTKESYKDDTIMDDSLVQMDGTSYPREQPPRDYIPRDTPHDSREGSPTSRKIVAVSGAESTTKRLHTRSERDTLRREGRWPEQKPSDNDVGMKMFKQRSLPRKHVHSPSCDGDQEIPTKAKKSAESDLSKSDPEFSDKFREITEKRKKTTNTMETRQTTTTKTTRTSTKNAAESCNKNVDELVNVFSTLESLQSQPGKGEDVKVTPGKVKKIKQELETKPHEERGPSPVTSVTQKLKEIEHILDSVDKNQQRMRPPQPSSQYREDGRYYNRERNVYTTHEKRTYREEHETREQHEWKREHGGDRPRPGPYDRARDLVTRQHYVPIDSPRPYQPYREPYGRRRQEPDDSRSTRPWSYTESYPVGSLSEGELYHDEEYTSDIRGEYEVYRGSTRKGRTRRRKGLHSRAFSDGEIEEFHRPYLKDRVITPGTPVHIRLYGLNLEKTELERSYDIDWQMFNVTPVDESVQKTTKRREPATMVDDNVPVDENVERTKLPQQKVPPTMVDELPVDESVGRSEVPPPRPPPPMMVDQVPADERFHRDQLPRKPDVHLPTRDHGEDEVFRRDVGRSPSPGRKPRREQTDGYRETVHTKTKVQSVKRQTSDDQTTRTTRKEPSDKGPPVKRPTESYPSDEQPPEKRYTKKRPKEEQPTKEVPIEVEPSDEIPIEVEPSEEVPIEVVPTKEVAIEIVPTKEVPTEEVPIEVEPSEEVPIEVLPDSRQKGVSPEDEYVDVKIEHMDDQEEVPPGKSSTPRVKEDYYEEQDESVDESRRRVKSSSSEKRESDTHTESRTHTTRTTRTTHTTTETVVKKMSSSGGRSSTSDIVSRGQPEQEPEEETARGEEGSLVAHEYLEMNADTGRPVNLTMLGRVVEDDDDNELSSQSREDLFLHTRLKMVSEQKHRTDKTTKVDVDETLRTSPTADEVDDYDADKLTNSEYEFDAESEPTVSEGPILIPISGASIVGENVDRTEQHRSRTFPDDTADIFEERTAVDELFSRDDINPPRVSLEEVLNPPTVHETEVGKENTPEKELPSFEWIPTEEVDESVGAERKLEHDFYLPDLGEPIEPERAKEEEAIDEYVVAESKPTPRSPRIVVELVDERDPVLEEVHQDRVKAPKLPEIQPPLPLVDETVTSEKQRSEVELPDIQFAEPERRPIILVDESINAPEVVTKNIFVPDFQELMPTEEPQTPVDETIFPEKKVPKIDIDFQEVVPEFPTIIETVPKSEKQKPDLPEIENEFQELIDEQQITDDFSEIQEAVQEPPRKRADEPSRDIDVIPDEDDKISDSPREKPTKGTEYFEVPKKMPVAETHMENEIVTETRTTTTVTTEKTFTKDIRYVSDTPPSKGDPVPPRAVSPHPSEGISESSSETSMRSHGSADVSSESVDVTLEVDETDNAPAQRKRRSRRGNRFDNIRRSGHLVPDSVVTQTVAPEPERVVQPSVIVPSEEVPISRKAQEVAFAKPSERVFGREKPSQLCPEMYLMDSDDGSNNKEESVEQTEEIEKTKVMLPEMEPWKIEEESKNEIEEVCEETQKAEPDYQLQLPQEIDEMLEKEMEALPDVITKDAVDSSPQIIDLPSDKEVIEKVPVEEKLPKDEVELVVELEPSEEDEDIEKTCEEKVNEIPEVEDVEMEEEVEREQEKPQDTSEDIEQSFEKVQPPSEEQVVEEIPEIKVEEPDQISDETPVEIEVLQQEPEKIIPEEDKEIPILVFDDVTKDDQALTPLTGDVIVKEESSGTSTKSTVETIIVEKTHSEISTTVTEISTKRYFSDRSVSSSEDERDYVHARVGDKPSQLRDVEPSPEDVATEPDDVAIKIDHVAPEPDNLATEPDRVATEPDDVATEPDDVAIKIDHVAPEPDNAATQPDRVATEPDGVATEPDEEAKPVFQPELSQEDIDELLEKEVKGLPEEIEDLPSDKEEVVEKVPVEEKLARDDVESVPSEVAEDIEKTCDEKVNEIREIEEKEEVGEWFEKEEKDDDKLDELPEEIEKSFEKVSDAEEEQIPDEQIEKPIAVEILQEPEKSPIVPEEDMGIPIQIINDVTTDDKPRTSSTDDVTVFRTGESKKSTVETIIVEKTHSEISTTVTEISTTKRISSDKHVSSSEDERDYVHIQIDNEQLKLRADEGTAPDEETPKPDDDGGVLIPIDVAHPDEVDAPETAVPTEVQPNENVPIETVVAILDVNYEKPQDIHEDSPDITEQPLEVAQITRTSSQSSEASSKSSVESDEVRKTEDISTTENVPISEDIPRADDAPITESFPSYEDIPIAEALQQFVVPEPEYESPTLEEERAQTNECESQTETDMYSETTQTEVTTKTTRETMTKEWQDDSQVEETKSPELNDSEMQTETVLCNSTTQTDLETSSQRSIEEVTRSSETSTKSYEETSKYSEDTKFHQQSMSSGGTQTDIAVDDFASQTSVQKTSEMSSMTENMSGTMMSSEGTQTELMRDDWRYMNEREMTRITRKTTKETRREYNETSSESRQDLKSDCPVCLQSLESSQYSFIKVADLSKYTAMQDFSSQTESHEMREQSSEYCFACGRSSSQEQWESRETSRTSEDRREHLRTSGDSQEHSRTSEDSREHSRTSENTQEHSRTSEDRQEHSRRSEDRQEYSRRTEDTQEHSVDTWEREMMVESESSASESSHFAIHTQGEDSCSLYCRRVGNHTCMLQKLASIIRANRKTTTAGTTSAPAEEEAEGAVESGEGGADQESGASVVICQEYRDVSVQTEGAVLPTEVFSEKDFEIYYNEERSPSWTAMTIAQGMQKEQESLIKQLDLLREVNQKLRDQKDAIQAAHEAQSKNYMSLSDELALAQNLERSPHKTVTRQGSEMSKYFETFNFNARLSSVDEYGEAVASDTPPKRKLQRTKKTTNSLQSPSVDGHAMEFVGEADGAEFESDRVFQDGELEEPERPEWTEHKTSEITMSEAEKIKTEQEFRDRKVNIAPGLLQNGSSKTKMISVDDFDHPLSTRTPPVGTEDVHGLNAIPDPGSHLQRVFKVVFVGNSGVGKSSFIHRYCYEIWKPSYSATIGVDFQVKSLELGLKKIALQLWDTAGQERFRSITKQYFRKADGVVILYDLTSQSSFLEIKSWMASVEEAAEPGCTVMLVGNKLDLCQEEEIFRAVDYEDAQKLTEDYGILYYETSAKTGENVNESMEKLASVLQEREDWQLHSVLNLKLDGKTKKKCCR